MRFRQAKINENIASFLASFGAERRALLTNSQPAESRVASRSRELPTRRQQPKPASMTCQLLWLSKYLSLIINMLKSQQQLSICLLSDLGLGLGPVLGLGLGLELQQLVAVCCEDVACLAAWLCWSGFPPSLSPTTPSSIALCSLPDKFNDSSSSRDSISHLAILKISCKCSNISVCLTYSIYPSPTRPCPARSQSVKCTLTFNIAFVYSIILYIFLIFLLFIVYRSQ